MKSKIIMQKRRVYSFKKILQGLVETIGSGIKNTNFIFRGILIGLVLVTLVFSLVNLKTNRDLKKVIAHERTGSILDEDFSQVKDSEFYQTLEKSIKQSMETDISKYIEEYINSNSYSKFFDEKTKSLFQQEMLEHMLSQMQVEEKLTETQQEEIRSLISEKINQIDYSAIENQIKSAIEGLDSKTNTDIEKVRESVMTILQAQAAEYVTTLASDISTTDNKLTKMLNEYQETTKKEAAIRYQYLNERCDNLLTEMNADYDELNSLMASNYSVLSNDIANNYSTLSDNISNNYSELSGNIESNYSELSGNIESNYSKLSNSISYNYTQLSENLKNNSDELLAKIAETNARISDYGSGEFFQYGIDKSSGAAGYYISGQFKPF